MKTTNGRTAVYMDIEGWKSIKDYEGLYEVSNTGFVRSVKREVKSRDAFRRAPSILLKPYHNIWEYQTVTLSKLGITKNKAVARLVALTFLENTDPEKKEVNHIDGNKDNNNISNLEWVTPLENKKHARATGLVNQLGENNPLAKLTVKKVREIRSLYGKYTFKQLGEMFNVDSSNIGYIVNRVTWKHI